HSSRAQGCQETGPARGLDPHAQTPGGCAPSGAAAQVLSLLRTRSCAARSAEVEVRQRFGRLCCGRTGLRVEMLLRAGTACGAPDCGGAVHVTVVAFDDHRVGATWEVASCDAGTSAPEACERALCDIIRRLQQHFDIASS